MLLSIIIPSFNQAALLQEALASIATQTFTDYEILVMDGMGDNGTAVAVNSFPQLPIKLISERDEGIYDAMNKGIRMSAGDYLFFMGCDDKLHDKNSLKNVFSQVNTSKDDFIYGDVIFTKDSSRYDGKFSRLKLMTKNICHQGIFVKRKVYDKLGLFDLKYKYLADWVFNMKCFNDRSVKKRHIPTLVAYYNNVGASGQYDDVGFLQEKNDLIHQYFSHFERYLYYKYPKIYKKIIS